MRVILAPLTRWLDRRIDARIVADRERIELEARVFMERLARDRRERAQAPSAGLAELTAETAQDIRAVSSRAGEA